MTAWNDFVKKIYHENHDKDSSYQFKQALKDASARKSEMGSSSAEGVKKPSKKTSSKKTSSKKSSKKSAKKSKKCKCPKKGGTKRRRKH